MEKLYGYIIDDDKPFLIDDYKDNCEPAEENIGKNTVAVEMPKYLRKKQGKSFMN